MNGSAMCVTLQYYFIKNVMHYLQNCLTPCDVESFIYSFRTSENPVSSSKLFFLSDITASYTNQDATWSQKFKLILLLLL